VDEEIKNLLKKNLEASEESLKILKKIHRDVRWRRLFGFAKFAVVIALLVFSYITLEPLLANIIDTYQKVLNPAGSQNVNLNVGINPDTIPSGLKNLIDGFLNQR